MTAPLRRTVVRSLLAAGLCPRLARAERAAEHPLWLPPPGDESDLRLARSRVDRITGDASAGPPRAPDAVWLDETLGLIARYQQNPLRASRALALLHAAMADAIALAPAGADPEASAAIAAHRAGGLVLAYLYPQEPSGSLEARSVAELARWTAGRRIGPASIADAVRAGDRAAASAVGRARGDGAERVVTVLAAGPPGLDRWRPAPPLLGSVPLEPLAGEWRTWVLRDADAIDVPPPPLAGSPRFERDLADFLAVARALTDEQRRIADRWDLGRGTVTPAGVWNLRARDLATAAGLGSRDQIRLRAAMNAAMADALIVAWRVKYRWYTARPITVVRDTIDPQFLSHTPTPAFPGYVSGHAAASGAAAAVLAGLLPPVRVEVERQAAEAARSRLYAGIHFAVDNDEGLALGRRVGAVALERGARVAAAR